ncbi:hypothetical protein T484DRAFT_1943808, partial [Baffinella frigidus]
MHPPLEQAPRLSQVRFRLRPVALLDPARTHHGWPGRAGRHHVSTSKPFAMVLGNGFSQTRCRAQLVSPPVPGRPLGSQGSGMHSDNSRPPPRQPLAKPRGVGQAD